MSVKYQITWMPQYITPTPVFFFFLFFLVLLFAYFQLLFINNIALMSGLLHTFLCINFLFQPGWSNHDQIYFPHQTTKAIKKNTKHWIQTLDSRQPETMLSTRTETNEMSERLSFCLETLKCIPRRENTDKKTPVVSLGWWSLQSDSHSWSVQGRVREGEAEQKESFTENPPCFQTLCVNEETLGDKGKRHTEEDRKLCMRFHSARKNLFLSGPRVWQRAQKAIILTVEKN